MLDNKVTGQYTHTLNISGMTVPGVYGCSVSNNKPSLAKAVAISNTEGTLSSVICNCVLIESTAQNFHFFQYS